MRPLLVACLLAGTLAIPAGAQPNPFKLPKLSLKGEVNYALSGDMKGTSYTAFDGDRMVTTSTSTTRMMGKESKLSSWSLVTADSMYSADLETKKGYRAPNLLPFLARAYDGLDKEGKQRFHANLNEMGAMFSRVLDIGMLGSSGEKKGEKTIAGELCEEREFMGFTVCTMKRGPRIPLETSGSLVCYRYQQTATAVSLSAPAGSAFDQPAGIVFEQAPIMQNPDSASRGLVGYLASQELSDSLAKARAELERAKAQAAAEGKPTEMTPAEKEQVRAACETLKNLDLNSVMASATKAMVAALKQAAVDEAKKSATNKLKGLIKKPKIP
jgi:hypothetical protein